MFKYLFFLFTSHSLFALTTLTVTLSSDSNPGGIGDTGDLRYCLNSMNESLNTTMDDYAIEFEVKARALRRTEQHVCHRVVYDAQGEGVVKSTCWKNGGEITHRAGLINKELTCIRTIRHGVSFPKGYRTGTLRVTVRLLSKMLPYGN